METLSFLLSCFWINNISEVFVISAAFRFPRLQCNRRKLYDAYGCWIFDEYFELSSSSADYPSQWWWVPFLPLSILNLNSHSGPITTFEKRTWSLQTIRYQGIRCEFIAHFFLAFCISFVFTMLSMHSAFKVIAFIFPASLFVISDKGLFSGHTRKNEARR